MQCFCGNILSVNAGNEVFRYLVEHNGKIEYVGNQLPERYRAARRVELGEKALLPAFVDTHQHFASFSTFHGGLNVMEARSNGEILDMVRDFAQKSPAKTLIAFGASPYAFRSSGLCAGKSWTGSARTRS